MKNDHAFPQPVIASAYDGVVTGGAYGYDQGMNMLEFYAGHALAIAASEGTWQQDRCIAERAFDLAEAMCNEAEKRRNQ